MSISTFQLAPAVNSQSITRFVQSASPEGIEAGVEAAVAEIVALNVSRQGDQKLGIAALDLAGGGDGHTFVAQVTFTTDDENKLYKVALTTAAPSDLLTAFHAGAYMASDATELAVAQLVTYDRLRAFDGSGFFAVFANALAGAAKGTRFMGLVVGFEGPF